MTFSKEALDEAYRQIASTLHKVERAKTSLEEKGEPRRYRSQITLAQRRIEAFKLALALIEQEQAKH